MRSRFLPFVLLVVGTLRLPAADLLLAATEAELQPIIARLEQPQTETRAGWQFWLGTIHGRSVVLARTEDDPLNAVAATTLAIRRYEPKLVLTFGAARAHDPSLQPGDLVLSREFAAFDGMVSPHRDGGTGTAPLAWRKLPHALITPGEKEVYQDRFPADAPTLALAEKVFAARGHVVAGVLGSAYQVNREADRISALRTLWGTSTENHDSAHIAGCARLLGVPVFGLHVITDQPGQAAGLVLQLLEGMK